MRSFPSADHAGCGAERLVLAAELVAHDAASHRARHRADIAAVDDGARGLLVDHVADNAASDRAADHAGRRAERLVLLAAELIAQHAAGHRAANDADILAGQKVPSRSGRDGTEKAADRESRCETNAARSHENHLLNTNADRKIVRRRSPNRVKKRFSSAVAKGPRALDRDAPMRQTHLRAPRPGDYKRRCPLLRVLRPVRSQVPHAADRRQRSFHGGCGFDRDRDIAGGHRA